MAETGFQSPFASPVDFTGVVLNLDIIEPAGANPPKTILTSGETVNIQVHWEIAGASVPMINPLDLWKVRVFYESLGPGGEGQLGAITDVVYGTFTPGNPALGPNCRHYMATIPSVSFTIPLK